MPLTISHPAASAPLTRFGLVLSALVIGSMAPDFPYFIPLSPNSSFSHSITGLFVYCIPLGLFSLAVFHFLVKYPALSLLPINHQQRLYGSANGFSFWPLRRFLQIILSLFLGAFTHLLWDSFTHPQGWVIKQFVILKSPVLVLGSSSVQVYGLLQHGSTILGEILLFYWYWKWYAHAKSLAVPGNLSIAAPKKLTIFITMAFISLAAAITSGITSLPALQASLYQRLFAGHVFIVGVSTFTAELLLFSAYWHLIFKKTKST